MGLTRFSTYDEVEAVYREYKGKAVYRFNKDVGGEEKEKKLQDAACEKCTKTREPKLVFAVSYETPKEKGSDEHDEMIVMSSYIYVGSGMAALRESLVILYKDADGTGAYMKAMDTDDESGWLRFTPHFFHRYNERCLSTRGVKTSDNAAVVEFLLRMRFLVFRFGSASKDRHSFMAMENGVAPCYKDGNKNMIEVQSFLPDFFVMGERDKEETVKIRAEYEKYKENQRQKAKDMAVDNFIKFFTATDLGYDREGMRLYRKFVGNVSDEEITRHCGWIKSVEFVAAYAAERCVDAAMLWIKKGTKSIDMFVVDQLKRIAAVERPLENTEKIKEPIVEILAHNEIKVSTELLDEMMLAVETKYKDKLTKERETMNSNQRTVLERILRDKKFKGFNTLANSVVKGGNGEVYINTVEPVFAVSRLIPKVNADSDKPRIQEAQMAWMEKVVMEGWCPQLKPYEDKYGKRLLWKCVEYLIQEGLWDSPTGADSINSKNEIKYKGFEAIHECAEFLVEKYPELALSERSMNDAEESEAAEQEEIDGLPIDADRLKDGAELKVMIPTNMEEAMVLANSLVAQSTILGLAGNCFKHYLEDTVKHLEQGDTKQLLKEAKDKDARITQLQQQVEKWKKNQEEAQGNYVKKSGECTELKNQVLTLVSEKEEIQKRAELLEASLNSANADNAEKAARIKELEAKSALPRKKVVPLTRITSMPMVGEKMKVQIVQLLKEVGCEIDEYK